MLDKSLTDLDNTPVLVLAGGLYEHVVDGHVQQFVSFSTKSFAECNFALFNQKSIDELLEDRSILP